MEQINHTIDAYFKSSLRNIALEPSPELMNKMAPKLAVRKGHDWKNLPLTLICVVAVLVCIYDFNYIIRENSLSLKAEAPVTTTFYISSPPKPVIYTAPAPVTENTKISKGSFKKRTKGKFGRSVRHRVR